MIVVTQCQVGIAIRHRVCGFCQEKQATKTYRQFYRQLVFPAVTISNLQRREAPLSTCNHC